MKFLTQCQADTKCWQECRKLVFSFLGRVSTSTRTLNHDLIISSNVKCVHTPDQTIPLLGIIERNPFLCISNETYTEVLCSTVCDSRKLETI